MKKQLIPILGLGLALVLGGCDNGNNNNGNDGVRTPDLIHQPSETILFMGKITEPESQSN